MNKILRIGGALFGAAALATGGVTAAATAASPSHDRAVFPLVRSAASVKAGCLTNANAVVRIGNQGPVEVMTIDAHGYRGTRISTCSSTKCPTRRSVSPGTRETWKPMVPGTHTESS
jgi:hypothetical protein